MIQEAKSTNKLVIERLIECYDKTVGSVISGGADWGNICNFEEKFNLSDLIKDGWEIIDVKVSSSISVSQSGTPKNIDHTILMLEKKVG